MRDGKRYRKLFPFQLDLNKPEEFEIAETIVELKERRAFSKTIRDGIRLIWDLSQGRVDVLNELFPWVLQQPAATPESGQHVTTSTIEQVMFEQLSLLEQRLIQQGNTPIPMDTTSRLASFEDDFEIKTAERDENNRSDVNFKISMAMLANDLSTLTADEIEYGVQTGKIPKGLAQKTSSNAGPKQIAEADIELSAPDFSDLEVEF